MDGLGLSPSFQQELDPSRLYIYPQNDGTQHWRWEKAFNRASFFLSLRVSLSTVSRGWRLSYLMSLRSQKGIPVSLQDIPTYKTNTKRSRCVPWQRHFRSGRSWCIRGNEIANLSIQASPQTVNIPSLKRGSLLATATSCNNEGTGKRTFVVID